jgi:Rieske Fe-S protein
MSPTRREFVAMAAASLALTVLNNVTPATADSKEPAKPAEPFLAGPLSDYEKAGVYDKYLKSNAVLLVSDGKELVALSTICPHAGGAISWVKEKNEFVCEKHKAGFTADGVNVAGAKAKRPMERFAIRLTKDEKPQVQVDPKKVLRKDKNQWGDAEASLKIKG